MHLEEEKGEARDGCMQTLAEKVSAAATTLSQMSLTDQRVDRRMMEQGSNPDSSTLFSKESEGEWKQGQHSDHPRKPSGKRQPGLSAVM